MLPWRFDFDIVVGQAEQHRVEFIFNQWIGRVRINVDGRRVVRDWRSVLPRSYSMEWKIAVGVQERHDVLIRKIMQKVTYAGARAQTVIVYVDGHPVGEYRTRLS